MCCLLLWQYCGRKEGRRKVGSAASGKQGRLSGDMRPRQDAAAAPTAAATAAAGLALMCALCESLDRTGRHGSSVNVTEEPRRRLTPSVLPSLPLPLKNHRVLHIHLSLYTSSLYNYRVLQASALAKRFKRLPRKCHPSRPSSCLLSGRLALSLRLPQMRPTPIAAAALKARLP